MRRILATLLLLGALLQPAAALAPHAVPPTATDQSDQKEQHVYGSRRSNASAPFSPSHFLTAVVDSLARSHSALSMASETLTGRASPVDQMTAIKNADIELVVAAGGMKEFLSSPNEHARDAADGIAKAYAVIRQSFSLWLSGFEKLLAVKSEDDLVEIRRQISDAKVNYQQASLMLNETTILAFGSCLIPDPKDLNHMALNMTAGERDQLLKQLDARFGPRLRKQRSEKDTGSLEAARTLRGLLTQKWRLAP
jgi:hypothetical protein